MSHNKQSAGLDAAAAEEVLRTLHDDVSVSALRQAVKHATHRCALHVLLFFRVLDSSTSSDFMQAARAGLSAVCHYQSIIACHAAIIPSCPQLTVQKRCRQNKDTPTNLQCEIACLLELGAQAS